MVKAKKDRPLTSPDKTKGNCHEHRTVAFFHGLTKTLNTYEEEKEPTSDPPKLFCCSDKYRLCFKYIYKKEYDSISPPALQLSRVILTLSTNLT
jgi:hypothetical protein